MFDTSSLFTSDTLQTSHVIVCVQVESMQHHLRTCLNFSPSQAITPLPRCQLLPELDPSSHCPWQHKRALGHAAQRRHEGALGFADTRAQADGLVNAILAGGPAEHCGVAKRPPNMQIIKGRLSRSTGPIIAGACGAMLTAR